MPFYEYQCSACGAQVEVLQKITDAPLRKCPECGRSKLTKLVSAPVFRLKGGGWYETDFKSDKDKQRNLVDRGDQADSSADKAGEKAGDKVGDKAGEKAGEKTSEKPAEKSADKDKPGEKSAGKPAVKQEARPTGSAGRSSRRTVKTAPKNSARARAKR